MKLHVDLESLQLIQGPGQRSAVASLRFKRGDAAALQVVFLENGVTPATIGNPDGLEIQIGIKPRNQFDRSYLAQSTTWSMPSEGDDTPTYGCVLSFNTLQLNSALNVGSESAEELPEINLMGEITWREDGGTSTSTRTFLVVVENDVNRGTEGIPSDASPPYPLPEELELRANKGTANGYAGLDATSKLPVDALPDLLRGTVAPFYTGAIDFEGENNTVEFASELGPITVSVAPASGVQPISHNTSGFPEVTDVVLYPSATTTALDLIDYVNAYLSGVLWAQVSEGAAFGFTSNGGSTTLTSHFPTNYIGQLYLNTSNDQLYYWNGNIWKNNTAFGWGPEDTTPADNDRLAVVSPTAGWLSLTRLWTYIAGRINTLTGAFTVGGNWSFTGQTQLASTQSATDANSAMTLGLVAARNRLAHTGSSSVFSLNTTEPQDVLSLPVQAGKTYTIKATINLIGTVNTGAKYGILFPEGIARIIRRRAGTLTPIMGDGSVVVGINEPTVLAEFDGYFVCQSNGFVRLQFAKNSLHPDQLNCRNTSLQITEN